MSFNITCNECGEANSVSILQYGGAFRHFKVVIKCRLCGASKEY